ncbi:hypothetical protein C4546_04365 [Candidatus Parcubacteria bacterium]|jgi:hypothetical protein|nr:MAG: hypothetical protein C4546_04365 [Candidatus Parcubacteria bacterium]
MAKPDKDNANKLSLALVGQTWEMRGGNLALVLKFSPKIPNHLKGESGTIKGTAYGQTFEADLAKEGQTVVSVPISDLSQQPRVQATLEIGGETWELTRDVPFTAPTNAVALTLVTNVFDAKIDDMKVKKLAVGTQVTSASRPVVGCSVKLRVKGFAEQNLLTDANGRCEAYFGPIEEDRDYEIVASTLQTGERRQVIRVSKSWPAREFKILDSVIDEGTFRVTCTVWQTKTGEPVPNCKVVVRCGSQKPKEDKTDATGQVSLGPFNFEPKGRLTKYTMYVEGFAPKVGNIKKPAAAKAVTESSAKKPVQGFWAGFQDERNRIRG